MTPLAMSAPRSNIALEGSGETAESPPGWKLLSCHSFPMPVDSAPCCSLFFFLTHHSSKINRLRFNYFLLEEQVSHWPTFRE